MAAIDIGGDDASTEGGDGASSISPMDMPAMVWGAGRRRPLASEFFPVVRARLAGIAFRSLRELYTYSVIKVYILY